jgi:hypothetical protein
VRRVNECEIANPLIETLSQVILHVFASCGRITANPEVAPKRRHFEVGDNPTGTRDFDFTPSG